MKTFTAHHTNPNAYEPDWKFLVNSKRGEEFLISQMKLQVKNHCRNYREYGDVIVTDENGVSCTVTITKNYTIA
jgi:hypothetical protein